MTQFILDTTLEQDSFFIADLELSQLRLINNANYPWLILVPRQANIVEITDLTDADYLIFCLEIKKVAKIMQDLLKPHKLNIAALGNNVKQMHMHIIARYKHDQVFPNPVWGENFSQYQLDKKDEFIKNLQNQFSDIKI